MKTYKHKPIIVGAEQFRVDVRPWPEGVKEILRHWTTSDNAPIRYNFKVVEQGYTAAIFPGDWVIKNHKGERYVIRQNVFHEMYEPTE